MNDEEPLKRCPNCHIKRALERRGNDGHCTACGTHFPGAFEGHEPETKKRVMHSRVYYEKRKGAIIADLFSIGVIATRRNWKIPVSTLAGLKKRWLTSEQQAKLAHKPGRPGSHSRAENGRLPKFPEFSYDWTPEIQMKWLEIYDKISEVSRSCAMTKDLPVERIGAGVDGEA